MKILLIVDDYLPKSTKVAARMMHDLALEFQRNNHQVSVLTPNPFQEKKLEIAQVEGVETLFFKSGEIKNISKVKRAINESLLSLMAWRSTKDFFRKNKYDLIIYYSPSIFWGGIVKRLKKLWNCKSYLILRDIFPKWAVDNGILQENSMIHKYFKFFEQRNYNNADIIGVMAPSIISLFEHDLSNQQKMEVLYNWSKIEELTSKKSNHYRKKLGLEGKTVFFYGGNIGQAQDMMNLFRLAINMKDDTNSHFLFVGQGDEVPLLLETKEKFQLNNVTYLPSVNQETYFKMLNEFDIGLFSLHKKHTTNNFPGKLLGYMNYSKPILGSVNKGNELKELINDNNAGLVWDNGEDEKLYQSALELVQNPKKQLEIGSSGKSLLINKFSVGNACKQIESRVVS